MVELEYKHHYEAGAGGKGGGSGGEGGGAGAVVRTW